MGPGLVECTLIVQQDKEENLRREACEAGKYSTWLRVPIV